MSLSTKPTAVINGKPVQSISTTSVPNSDITWETTTTYNVGADLRLWDGLLSAEADVFYKVTTNILQSQAGENPPSIGSNFPAIVNSGVVDVKGFELSLKHEYKVGDLAYTIGANT